MASRIVFGLFKSESVAEGARDHRQPIAACVDRSRLPVAAAALACLSLTVCAPQTPGNVTWVKSGADDQTVARELNDCTAKANAALASQQGINADINATLGGTWQLSNTQGIESQMQSEQATSYAQQMLNSCMRAKGFTKQS